MRGRRDPEEWPSADIEFALGQLHEMRGEREKVIARYKSALEKAPSFMRAKSGWMR